MVTGPMPRNPKATRPKANTAGASMIGMPATIAQAERAYVVANRHQSHDGEAQVVAEKLPATKPDRMSSDAPPSSAEVTTSFTCPDVTEVNTFTSSGMTAPARVPQEMMVASFHHWVVSPPSRE